MFWNITIQSFKKFVMHVKALSYSSEVRTVRAVQPLDTFVTERVLFPESRRLQDKFT
ncbi:hypothetical protein SIAM614_13243 [Stappia aggregata IAM 12614]|uniref:Uncharacterized protein n=1 Tax=Roseibium aggregatum (strain ATCC 25650 / DSM 13394 / JCM 20685 / NBRC 16684 / NCIMB 2208 / IAM 12614 / B1) TaxID=384765 RepID=A0NQC4_ROSAI|nr:hypothetical protein SIAM614_13243 [Stappia aggregata IAM 12614] [Roseibium aggregatum IAM 12614]